MDSHPLAAQGNAERETDMDMGTSAPEKFTQLRYGAKGILWQHNDARVMVLMPWDGSQYGEPRDTWHVSWAIGNLITASEVHGDMGEGDTFAEAMEASNMHWLLQEAADNAGAQAQAWFHGHPSFVLEATA